jgi:hypothetical protein
MTANVTEQRVAETILEKGVRVQLPAPFFLPFRKNVGLILRQPKAGTLFYTANIFVRSGIDINNLATGDIGEAHQVVVKNMKPMVRIIAALFLNSKWKIKLFCRPLANWLMWKLTARKMGEIAVLAIAYGGVQNFTTTIRLIGAMRITAPKNLSPTDEGS